MNAIILAGGRGTRLPGDKPKHLHEARGKSVLSWQLDYLLGRDEINHIVLALGVGADQIVEFVKKHYSSASIEISIESKPLGTAGGLKLALQKTTSPKVLVLNGDDLTNTNISALSRLEENTICIAHPRLGFGLVREESGYAVFEEKPILDEWVSYGWYLFICEELTKILPDEGSLEYDVFPKIKLRVYKHEGFWHTFNSKKDFEEFEALPDLPTSLT